MLSELKSLCLKLDATTEDYASSDLENMHHMIAFLDYRIMQVQAKRERKHIAAGDFSDSAQDAHDRLPDNLKWRPVRVG